MFDSLWNPAVSASEQVGVNKIYIETEDAEKLYTYVSVRLLGPFIRSKRPGAKYPGRLCS